jgi:hypothetical protein
MDTKAALQQEWRILQDGHQRYEGASLWVKLVAVVLVGAGVAVGLEWWFLGLLVLVLWLQEGIFKTCQARLGERLLQVEAWMHRDAAPPGSAFLLHTEWLARRGGPVVLLREYAASAARPTVAFPYAVLLLILLVLALG